MKKINRIFLIFFSIVGTTYAQNRQVFTDQDQEQILITKGEKNNVDVRIPIMKAIGSSMDMRELIKIKKNTGHVMSVGVSFNVKGEVDTVYLSKILSPEIQEILKPDGSITKKVREKLKLFSDYKSKVVVFPVLIFDLKGDKLEYSHITLKEFIGIWPELSTDDKKRPLVLLDPFLNGFLPPVE